MGFCLYKVSNANNMSIIILSIKSIKRCSGSNRNSRGIRSNCIKSSGGCGSYSRSSIGCISR
jgi:hypothetical protein